MFWERERVCEWETGGEREVGGFYRSWIWYLCLKSGFRSSFNGIHFYSPMACMEPQEGFAKCTGPLPPPALPSGLLYKCMCSCVSVQACCFEPVLWDVKEKASATALTRLMRKGTGGRECASSPCRCTYSQIGTCVHAGVGLVWG